MNNHYKLSQRITSGHHHFRQTKTWALVRTKGDNELESVEYTIAGGGICGVLTALQLKQDYPNAEVLLIEKEPFMGHHNTTRNSGVLHAGIYYQTASNKHKMCMAGYHEWASLAKQYNIPHLICGKYIIATRTDEIDTLNSTYQNAQKNGVAGLRQMTTADIAEIQEYCRVEDGFFSPLTGILDISTAINNLRDELVRLGGIVLMKTEVTNLKSSGAKIIVDVGTEPFATNYFINCAGAGAVDLRKKLNLNDIENLFVKGNYLKLNKPYYNKKLIYPVPLKNLHGLGVHTSFHMDGQVRFGPNTEVTSEVNYLNSEKNLDLMYPAIREKFKNIEKSDLSIDYAGVRTKIMRNGQLHPDFLIQGPKETHVPGYYEMLGIESPGLTAAPALAKSIIEMIKLLN